MTGWSLFFSELLGVVATSFISAWIIQMIYWHFAQRFGWPWLGYWEVWMIYVVIGSVGHVFRGSPRREVTSK